MTKNFEGALVVLDHLGEESQPFQIINGPLVSSTHLRAHETKANHVCRHLIEKKNPSKHLQENETKSHLTV